MEPLLILCGPTGVGKTDFALHVAERLDAEIVSADAGQVYIGFDIGTAKPSSDLQARIRHHCIDLWQATEQSNVARWVEAADAAITDIRRRGKQPLIVGGTGLYIKALLHGLFRGPNQDIQIRRRLQTEFDERGGASLHERLATVDPQAARKIHPNDSVRLIRALEVYELTGQPISELQAAHRFQKERYPAVLLGLNRDRENLYALIDSRVADMMSAGWVEEAKELLRQWGGDVPAFQLIGYREIRDALIGDHSKAELIPQIQRACRHYAKRQLTWFRAEKELRWLDASRGLPSLIEEVASL